MVICNRLICIKIGRTIMLNMVQLICMLNVSENPNFKSEGSDLMLCHMIIDLGVVLCARSGDWAILVQR